jgi:hypothetical protein
MQSYANSNYRAPSAMRRAFGLATMILLMAALVWPAMAGPQTTAPGVVVGRLYGADVIVKNAVSFESTYGMSTALLANGSEITVRSGRAQIDLMHGGAIAICGPAHFTLLESGGAITLALEYGRVRPQLEAQVTLTVYTPMIVATPVAIGSNPRDLTVGLTREGAMCTLTSRGAARIEQQLTGQSLLVPQGGEIALNGGQLGAMQSASGSCDCELLVTGNQAPKNLELSRPVANPATRPRPATAPPEPPRTEQPIYRVYLPPLSFDAMAPEEPPDPDPAHILLVRQAEPLAEPVFATRKEPAVEGANDYAPPVPVAPVVAPLKTVVAAPAPRQRKSNVLVRFWGAIFGRKGNGCVGSGCGSSGN